MATTEGRVASEPGITRFSAGLRFHQLGELHQAEECYRETIRIDPEHPDANHLLGVVALQQGRHDESIAFLSKALRLKPSTAEYHNNIASASTRRPSTIGRRSISSRTTRSHNTIWGTSSRNWGVFKKRRDTFDRPSIFYRNSRMHRV